EAVIAAVYLDSGYDFVQKFILKFFSDILKTGAIVNYLDHKTRLQEYIQSKTTDKIKYNLIKEEGPPHDKIFYVQVIIGDKNYESGTGKSKKEAEQNAAQKNFKII
ncbi:Ribonuclease 3, partial [Candidatus Arthromitus sp. SFB-2]